jgi:hypothetical protein
MPKYPKIEVRLSGKDGNAFAILGRVQAALGRAGVPDDEIKSYTREATTGDYDHLLQVTMGWVEVS